MKQETTQNVSMQVNQANLVKGLKYSFTNKTTVLVELMQNARRAGASAVSFDFDPGKEILWVNDDGCGIDSMEILLTVAESGWDTDIVKTEHPFGIGFLSALFACQYLDITSKGGCISVMTEEVLTFQPVSVAVVPEWNGITEIKLSKIGIKEHAIEDALKKLARGYSIPVIFNGKELERPMAINSGLHFVDTEIGSIYLCGLNTPLSGGCRSFEVFLQGQLIFQSRHHLINNNSHIIHLDSSSFYARLPDREKLVNEKEVESIINTTLKEEIEKRLISMKGTLTETEFVGFYSVMKAWNLERLLNDISEVPVAVLTEIIDYPNCNTDAFGSFEANVKTSMSRQKIEERGIVAISDEISDEGSARYLFAQQRNHFIYSGGLDSQHWINNLVRRLDGEAVTIEIINESHCSVFKGSWVWLNVCFCQAYKISIGNEQAVITDVSMYTGQTSEEDIAYVVKGDDSSDVLKQASSYNSEYEGFQETTWDSDSSDFSSFVIANTIKDPSAAIKLLLPDFTNCPSLFGRQFILTLDNIGKIKTVISAV